MTDRETETQESNAPDFVLRDGNLRSATWRAEGEFGPMYNTRITKTYRDEDGSFRETTTLSAKDLLRVSELARETHHEVLGRQREHALERRAEQETGQVEEPSQAQRQRFKSERSGRGTRRSKSREPEG